MKHPIGWFLLFLAVASSTSGKENPSKNHPEKGSFDETVFVLKSASCGMLEMELGNLAARRASSEKLKAFGKRMAEDHQRANEKLRLVSGELGVQIGEKSLQPDDQKHLDRLREMRGKEFERHYLQHLVKDYEQSVALFRRAAKEARLKSAATFAKETLPILEEHLKLAREFQEAVEKNAVSK